MMKTEVRSRELAKLLALTPPEIRDLVRRGIIVSGSKRGSYRLQESTRNYVEHLRKLATNEDTIEQATIDPKPVAPLVHLDKTNAPQMRAEKARDLEKLGTSKLSSFRKRILTVGSKGDQLLPSDHVRLTATRVQSFRIYIRDGRCHTVWDK
jgi:phage terminase Nu1 subunit (DNA packaging protein)